MTEPQRMEAMGTLGIYLIGAPRIELDQVHVPGPRGRKAWVSDLETIGARTGMNEMLVRAQLHRAALGDPGAPAAARLFAERIDKPVIIERANAWA